jgi:Ni,Fe-hydrogenase III large subunit
VLSRFEQTGVLSRTDAVELGLVGPAARASGVRLDVRRDHPAGIYRFAHVPATTAGGGDVLARALVRRVEAQRSLTFLGDQIRSLPEEPLRIVPPEAPPRTVVVSLVEGWRGEIAHVVVTDGSGGLAAAKIVDPSFHNWLGLAIAMRGNEISDFPLCNKSFNLSYAGHDL